MRDFFIGIFLAAALVFCSGFDNKPPDGYQHVTENYIVKSGDTLWSIAEKYMAKNTYGKRDIREFYHGIIEVNYDTVFKDRPDRAIHPGDNLEIHYWTSQAQ